MPLAGPHADGHARAWWMGGLVLTTAAGVALCVSIAGGRGAGSLILFDQWQVVARLAAWSAAWALGVLCVLRLPRRIALGGVFAAAIALRLAALAGPPQLSDDVYRYAWDARVQTAGIDPYRYAPDDAPLAGLREPWLWPDEAHCAQIDLGRPPGCTRINRASEPTIYPPLAQAWFTGVHNVAGVESRHKAWQVAGLLVDVGLIAVLAVTLRAWRRDERWTALYALSPFPVIEVVNNGHVDGLVALLVVLALLVAARRRPGWAGALIGAAALVKLYPAVLLVALAVIGGRRLPSLARAVAGAAVVVALGYLPHVVAVGVKVIGYLPGYLREEHYDAGGRYLLAGLLGLPAVPTAVLAGGAVAAVAVWVLVRRPECPRGSVALMGALLLATTPVQPWYAITLLALAAVAVAPAWSVVAAAAYPYYVAVLLGSSHVVAIGRVSYGVALATVVAGGFYRAIRRKTGRAATRVGGRSLTEHR